MPVQAPKEFSDKYKGIYDAGWTVMREKRHSAAEEAGIVPKGTKSLVTPGTLEWKSLSQEQQKHHARRMEVYAGMVDAMDTHIGRLMDYLRSIDEYENTIFIFTSDNGAEGSPLISPTAQSPLDQWFQQVDYETGIETLGERGSWVAIGPSNATIAASPLAYYKFHANEGGLRVPLIVSGPGITGRGQLTDEFVFVTDLAPTILGLLNIGNHNGSWQGGAVEEIVGNDFSSFLAGENQVIHSVDEAIGYELGGNSALFKGDHKIVINKLERNETEWSLYNIKIDPGEVNDLKAEQPQLYEEMLADYEAWEKENDVLPMPEGYNRGRAIFRRGFN